MKRSVSAGLLALALSSAALASPQEDYEKGLTAYRTDDLITAMQLLERSANAGYPPAQALLAYILDKAEQDAQAFELYRKAAEAGDPVGQYGLGTMYASGEGVSRDTEQAVHWFRRSAEQGYGQAMVVLGDAYLAGDLGLPQDQEEGMSWINRAAEAGYKPASDRLELMVIREERERARAEAAAKRGNTR